MNITPEVFLAELKNGNKSEHDLNRLENPYISHAEVTKLIRYGHTLESAKDHLSTDYSNGFTICSSCGSYYHLGKGFTKHLSKGCLHCEPEKHNVYYHHGNNEVNYKTSPRYMSIMFDNGIHYCKDKLQIEKFKSIVSDLNL